LFEKILVPLDGSEHSMRALAKAVQIAKKFDGKITLVHVCSVPGPFSVLANAMAETGIPAREVITPKTGKKRMTGGPLEVTMRKILIRELSPFGVTVYWQR